MHRLAFRPYDPDRDARLIYSLYQDPHEQALFSHRVPLTTLAEFEEWLDQTMRTSYHEFRTVALVDDGKTAEGTGTPGCPDSAGCSDGAAVGFMFAYDYRPFDLHCKVCLYMAPAWRGTGMAGLMGARFIGDLFTAYPLRKVYALVYAFNDESLRSNLQAGFEEEAVLRTYRYLDGAFHDCHVLSLSREAYQERLAPLVAAAQRER